jgi:outer membrane lipoprotein-sorting protein
MRKVLAMITGTLVWMVIIAVVHAADAPDVSQIVERSNLAAYYGGDDGRSLVSMTITDAQGRTRNREFVILRKDIADGGEQNFYVYFRKPSDVRKMVFMVHKHIEADDDRWLYLPALDLVKRIAASDKRTSFVGSHFFYEDVSGRAISEDSHNLVETTDQHYVLQSTPKDPATVEFSAYKIWIDKQNFLPTKAEYTDTQGRLYRRVEALETGTIQGIATVTKAKVSDLLNGGHTVSEFKKIQYNMGLQEKIFTERYLRRAPKEVRR